MVNAASLLNFGTTGLAVGDWLYSAYARTAPGYLPLNSYTTSYLVSSYPALAAIVSPVVAPVSYVATARTLPGVTQAWQSVAYGNGIWVAIGGTGTQAGSSPDGITWTARTMPTSAQWNVVTFANGVFVALATAGSTAAATSTDGINWTARTMPSASNWSAIAYGNGVFAALAQSCSSKVHIK